MKLVFAERAWADDLYWQQHDRKQLERINMPVKDCLRAPFARTGKPVPLRGDLAGWWSRRIDREHRLVYKPTGEGLLVAQGRYHY